MRKTLVALLFLGAIFFAGCEIEEFSPPSNIVVGPVSGNTSEHGESVSFSVALSRQPDDKVAIAVRSDATDEGIVTGGSAIAFTPGDWSPRIATVTGRDDATADEDQSYNIIVEIDAAKTSDDLFIKAKPASVRIINESKVLSGFQINQVIATNGGSGFKYFTIGAGAYLAVGNYSDDSTFDVDSKIYKWNGASFAEFQSLATTGGGAWEYFTIGADSYLAINNFWNGSTHNLNSRIYKWSGSSFVDFQIIPTSSAGTFEHFTIGTDSYLAVPNAWNGSNSNIDSKIYKWDDGISEFVEFQSIPTSGAGTWEYFSIGTDSYLAVSNAHNNWNYETDSKIYKWDGELSRFVDFQSLPTIGASHWKYFTIGSDSYLAVANKMRDDQDRDLDSQIYKWDDGLSRFVDFQSIPTSSAIIWEYFTVGGESYLAIAQTGGDVEIYKWNGSLFDEFHSIDVSAVSLEYFVIGVDSYLAIAKSEQTYKNYKCLIYKGVFE